MPAKKTTKKEVKVEPLMVQSVVHLNEDYLYSSDDPIKLAQQFSKNLKVEKSTLSFMVAVDQNGDPIYRAKEKDHFVPYTVQTKDIARIRGL